MASAIVELEALGEVVKEIEACKCDPETGAMYKIHTHTTLEIEKKKKKSTGRQNKDTAFG